MIPRDYQEEGVRLIDAAFADGATAVLFVGPTGTGKTVIADMLIAKEPGRVLFIAHRRELIKQTFGRFALSHNTGIIMGDEPMTDCRVQVASIQTLVRRDVETPDLIIVDEAHLSVTKQWKKTLQRFKGARIVGLTATPFRTDGAGLGDLYDRIVTIGCPDSFVERRVLVPVEAMDLECVSSQGWRSRGGDFAIEDMMPSLLASIDTVVFGVVEHAFFRKALCFAATVEHSQMLVNALVAADVRAEHVDGNTDQGLRDDIWRRFRSGATSVVSNVGIVTEGFDVPDCDAVILARPTKSLGLFIQMVGRGLRPSEGKTDCLCLDFGGTFKRLGWPTRDLTGTYTLHGKTKRDVLASDAVKSCGRCFKAWRGQARACPYCGWIAPSKALKVETTRRRLQRLTRDGIPIVATESAMITTLRWLAGLAANSGYKAGWVYHKAKAKHGRTPTWQEMKLAGMNPRSSATAS